MSLVTHKQDILGQLHDGGVARPHALGCSVLHKRPQEADGSNMLMVQVEGKGQVARTRVNSFNKATRRGSQHVRTMAAQKTFAKIYLVVYLRA